MNITFLGLFMQTCIFVEHLWKNIQKLVSRKDTRGLDRGMEWMQILYLLNWPSI